MPSQKLFRFEVKYTDIYVT